MAHLSRTRTTNEQKDSKTWRFSSSWASSDDVWIKMLNKELKYVHDKSYMQRHPKLQPKMRAILLDWLLEVRKWTTENISSPFILYYSQILKMQKPPF